MSHNNSIKKLLNIKEDILQIINVEDENINNITNKVIYATATKDNSNCPCCSKKLVKNGNKIVNIKILKSCQYNSILRVKKQRYFCKNCNKSFSQELNFVDKNSSISNDVKLAIKLELREAKTVKAIAKEFNVSQSTVVRIIDGLDDYKVNYNYLPAKLCFDEFKSTKDTRGVNVNISLKILYNYIHKELFIKFTKKDMCYKKDRKKKNKKEKTIRRQGGKSIEQRSEIVNNREEIGHFEMDTVIGKRRSSACLLVLTDRKSRLEIIRKIESKTIKNVVRTVKNIVKDYPKLIKTITSDNGSEFMNAEAIEELGIEYFYAHSYCSGERGSNENNNKLIRRHIPKGIDIGTIDEEKIREIEEWMNSYPRKLFNGKSSLEIYSKELIKYFS